MMNYYKLTLASVIFSGSLWVPALAESSFMILEDLKGRQMEITVLRKEGEKIVIERVDNGKEYKISPDSLSESSQAELLEIVKNLKPAYPPINADVVIGTRRKDHNGSSYMRKMDVSAKVTLTNEKANVDSPPCKGEMVFLGQNQKFDREFQILSNQKFTLTPTKDGTVFEAKPFATTYDSDNKGDGNIGGFKYEGYLLVVRDMEDKVLFTKTVYSKIKKALELDVSFADELSKLPTGTLLNDSLKKN